MRPDRAAVVIAAFIAADAAIALACGAPWAAVILAGLGLGALALFWHVPILEENSDLEALLAATRECAQCTRDRGPCTCAKCCGNICCLAGLDDVPPTPLRFTDWDSRELSE